MEPRTKFQKLEVATGRKPVRTNWLRALGDWATLAGVKATLAAQAHPDVDANLAVVIAYFFMAGHF